MNHESRFQRLGIACAHVFPGALPRGTGMNQAFGLKNGSSVRCKARFDANGFLLDTQAIDANGVTHASPGQRPRKNGHAAILLQANGLLHRWLYEADHWRADGAFASFPRALALSWHKRGLWPRDSALPACLSAGEP